MATAQTIDGGKRSASAGEARHNGYLGGRKWLFELLLLAVLLPAWLSVFAVVYLILLIPRRGAVLLKQERVGQAGVRFQLYKFRTLHSAVDVPMDKGPGHDGPGLLFLGRWLRSTSLDEIPQLINILKGEMCLVGPRPFLPRDPRQLSPEEFEERHALRPGLTGLWQVTRSYDDSDHGFLGVDCEYRRAASALLDLRILLMTVGYVLQQRGR